MDFSIEESKENDLSYESSNRKHQNANNSKPFIFANPTGSKNKGAPLLGLAKFIYYE